MAAAISLVGSARAADQNATEDQIGRQVYDELRKKGEILHDSPYYAVLDPIATQIKSVADGMYWRPFTFILVHEAQPNAFSVPGGNVYVTDALMRFVDDREELAGVLCHETAHAIHHDVVHNMAKDQRLQRNVTVGAAIVNILTGGRAAPIVNGLANLDLVAMSNHYSREVETAADLTGADVCAQAGSNPWGLVWLFRQFEKASSGGQFEMLSDHPTDDHRIADLQAHFRANAALFAGFDPELAHATRLAKPSLPREDAGGSARN